MVALIRAIILLGSLTYYAGPYIGGPLRCGGVYDDTHDWIAVDIDHYEGWRCGDLVEIEDLNTGDFTTLRIKDSGPLSDYCVREDGRCREIVGDVPKHVRWWGEGMSTSVRMVNRSELLRQWVGRER